MHNRPVRIIERGSGEPTLLIHGTAADAMTWSYQLVSIKRGLRLLAYDRRAGVHRMAGHVADAIEVLDRHAIERAVVCGSSFGGIVALELARHHPERVRAAIVCEPPLPCGDGVPTVPGGFGCAFDRAVAARGGAAGAEMFLRAVLGEAAYADLPQSFRARSFEMWNHVRDDTVALAHYRVDYAGLRADVPISVIAGERSPAWYRDTVDALAAALGVDPLVAPGAGHMMHAEAPRWFNDHLRRVAGVLDPG